MSLQPQHPIAEATELAIAPCISGTTLLVVSAIDFDDQHRTRREH